MPELHDISLPALLKTAREDALQEAIRECDRHAEWLRKEAHAGGDWTILMAKHGEAVFLANNIRKIANT